MECQTDIDKNYMSSGVHRGCPGEFYESARLARSSASNTTAFPRLYVSKRTFQTLFSVPRNVPFLSGALN